jgi:tryptophan-rich sensory protein
MSVANKTRGVIEQITNTQSQKWRWYHGVAFYILVQALTFSLAGLTSKVRGNKSNNVRDAVFGDVSYFKGLKQSVITPPSWVFGPAWTINNISTIYGNLRVLNMPKDTPGRDPYIALQATSWLNYALFSAAYFSLRSPINAFFLTVNMFFLTMASVIVAIFRLKDTKVALSLATLSLWLIIASTAATFQVLWNRDDLYKVGPFTQPNPTLVRDAR